MSHKTTTSPDRSIRFVPKNESDSGNNAEEESTGELTAAGIRVQVVEARSAVRDLLWKEGVDAELGGINRFTTVAEAVESLNSTNRPPWNPVA